MLSAFIGFLQLIFPFLKEWIFGKSSAARWAVRNVSIAVLIAGQFGALFAFIDMFGYYDREYKGNHVLKRQHAADIALLEANATEIAGMLSTIAMCSKLTGVPTTDVQAHAKKTIEAIKNEAAIDIATKGDKAK